MKLLAVSHSGLVSGAERVLVRLLGQAVAAGWTVRCASPPGPLRAELAQAGIAVVAIPDLKLAAGPRPLAVPRLPVAWAQAAPTLRRAAVDCDVVLANGLLALPPLRLLPRRLPVAWLVHDVIHKPDWRALLRLVAGRVTLALPVSEAVAAPLRAHGVRVALLRNGTGWPVAPAPLHHEDPPVVGVNALLTPWKGQSVLLEAVAALPRRDVRVELLGGHFPGDRGYVDALRARAAAPDLAGRVDLVGHVSDPLERMRGWTVAVVASVEPEAAPLALLEQMSLGLPVVATDAGGSPEVLDGAGLLVPPGDAGALADALARLLDDPSLRARCAAAGRAAIDPALTLPAQAALFLKLLTALTEGEWR